MEFTHSRTIKFIGGFLLLAAITQVVYTILWQYAKDVPRLWLWSVEAFLFVMLLPFAGSALAKTKHFALAFSAIAFSAVLNVIQVGVGLTQFGPGRAASKLNPDTEGFWTAIYHFSFFGYNAAKMLLAFAAVIFGLAMINAGEKALNKPLGLLAVVIGVVAFIANAGVMMFGMDWLIPRPLAGGTGVAVAFILGISLLYIDLEDEMI